MIKIKNFLLSSDDSLDKIRSRHPPSNDGDYRAHGTDRYHIDCDAARLLALFDAIVEGVLERIDKQEGRI